MQDPLSFASLFAAFAAGVLSVMSPCVMPLMPAYLSLISGMSIDEIREGRVGFAGLRRRVLTGCSGFVGGFSIMFVLLGASATVVGRVLLAWRIEIFGVEISSVGIAGVVIILMGLHVIGWLPIRFLYRSSRLGENLRPKGFFGTFAVGAAFALGWSPCVGPILGGILTIAGGRETVTQGMLLLALYSTGLGVPFFLAGWSIEFFFRCFERVRRHYRAIEIGAGVLLVAVGLLVVTERLTALNSYFLFMNRLIVAAESAFL